MQGSYIVYTCKMPEVKRFHIILIPKNSKRISDSEESTNPAVRMTERKL